MSVSPFGHPRVVNEQNPAPPSPELSSGDGYRCPQCAGRVDPSRTSQALRADGKILLFCAASCLKAFVEARRAAT